MTEIVTLDSETTVISVESETTVVSVGEAGPPGVGLTGATGATGATGQGVPVGGTAGQPLVKIDATNFNTQWSTLANFKTWLALTLSDITTALGFTPANTSHTHGTTDIDNDAITFAKLQNIGTDRLIGRDTAATGDPEEIALNATLEFTGAGAVQRAALTGDVTAAAGSNTTAIAADAVTYAKMQNVSATDKILGRATAAAGDVEEIACTAAARAFLDDIDAQAQRNTLVLGTGDTVRFGTLGLGLAPTYTLDVGEPITVSFAFSSSPVARFGTNTDGISGVQMSNSSSGTVADFRFLIKDGGDHYIAFAQPGTGNTATLFGITRSTGDFIFSNGGVSRTLAIGNVQAAPIIFGTTNLERMRILSGGDVGIGETAPTARLHAKGSVTTTVVEKVQGAASQTANLMEWQNSASGVLAAITAGGSFQLAEMTAPAAPATNNVRIYAEDNGAGKTRLMALFPTGAAVQLAIEP